MFHYQVRQSYKYLMTISIIYFYFILWQYNLQVNYSHAFDFIFISHMVTNVPDSAWASHLLVVSRESNSDFWSCCFLLTLIRWKIVSKARAERKQISGWSLLTWNRTLHTDVRQRSRMFLNTSTDLKSYHLLFQVHKSSSKACIKGL